jgi:L-lactate dehydrogenase
MNAMKPIRQDAIIVVVSHPVDLLTSLAMELSGLPESQVIGSGTFLDSVRLRRLLADRIGVSVQSHHKNLMYLYVVNFVTRSRLNHWTPMSWGCMEMARLWYGPQQQLVGFLSTS